MNLLSVSRQPQSLMPSISDLFDAFPPLTGLRPLFDTHVIRVEDELTEQHYLIRAELPGIEPDKDVSITVHNGLLTIEAKREERHTGKARSEFRYGSFARTVSLPPGAKADDIEATYTGGVLTVTVPLAESEAQAKRIEVRTTESTEAVGTAEAASAESKAAAGKARKSD